MIDPFWLKLCKIQWIKYKYTYHTLVPDNGHPLLSAIDAFRNQAEVIFAHSTLSSVKGTVCTSCHLQVTAIEKVKKGQCITESKCNAIAIIIFVSLCWTFGSFSLPGEQGVEIVRCGWVGAQGRGGDVGSCLGPVLTPVVWAVCSQACGDWLSIDHSTWKSRTTFKSSYYTPGVCYMLFVALQSFHIHIFTFFSCLF